MKKEDLQALGLNDEQIKGVHALNGLDVNAEKEKTTKAQEETTKLQKQLSETQEGLKKFDGVDLEEHKKQLAELSKKLEEQEKSYAQEKSDREYNEWLTEGLKATKAKSVKALQAELGDKLDILKESKNRDGDLKKILDENKESYAWMLVADEAINNPVKPTGTGSQNSGNDDAAIRAAMGLPQAK